MVVVTQLEIRHGAPNPVLAEIERRWPHVEVVSEGAEHGFHTLRHARHLAPSTSTFATAAAMTSTGLRTLHVPRWDRMPDLNITETFPVGCDLGFERFDHWIDGYREMTVWRNTPEQRELMLRHSIDGIRVAAGCSDAGGEVG